MSASRQRALSTRISEDVYVALAQRAQAEQVTICSLVAQLLADAVGEDELAPADPSPDPDTPTRPQPTDGTVPGEEMISRSEYERLRWQWRLESWQQGVETRQARMEQGLAALDRRLAEVLARLPR